MPTIKRTVYFYDLEFLDRNGDAISNWREIFRYARGLVGRSRCQQRVDRLACFRFLQFNPQNVISGHLVFIRENALARITDLDNDTDRDLLMAANEGLIETTQLAIAFGRGNHPPRLAIEYNHFGPRVGDLVKILRHHAPNAGVGDLAKIVASLVVRDGNHEAILNQIGRVSSLKMRVYRENLNRINQYAPTGVVSGLNASNGFDQAEYIEVKYKFNYSQQTTLQQARGAVLDLVHAFQDAPERMTDFDLLEATAEDSGTGGSIKPFDLLSAELRLDIQAATVPGYSRVIDSTDVTARLVDAAIQYATNE
ncbi:hypothetical protein LRS06_24250 [Hymenobacter sp. J193]|uniref:hypothetical protein n=1 Tax=Hymenobacter sp. J193 TaxID=2898429 RepID=UPI002151747D|nr:hypothetical protein [Hymenobacter sp. J193]MCR5890842.1 hypothetical protein [Hymenobacter sp. J193]